MYLKQLEFLSMQISSDLHLHTDVRAVTVNTVIKASFIHEISIFFNNRHLLWHMKCVFACVLACLSRLPLSDKLPVQTGNPFLGVCVCQSGSVLVFLRVCLRADKQQTCHGILQKPYVECNPLPMVLPLSSSLLHYVQ